MAKGSNGVTTIFFKLLGIPWVKGDAVNMTEQLPLGEAYDMLKEQINSGALHLEFNHKGKVKIHGGRGGGRC